MVGIGSPDRLLERPILGGSGMADLGRKADRPLLNGRGR